MSASSPKLLSLIWPFLMEWIFGDTDVSFVLRRNKLAVFFMVVNVVFFILLVYMTREALQKHQEVMAQRKKITELTELLKTTMPGTDENSVADAVKKRLADQDKLISFYEDQNKTLTDALATAQQVCHTQPARPSVKSVVKPQHSPKKPVNNLKQKLEAIRRDEESVP